MARLLIASVLVTALLAIATARSLRDDMPRAARASGTEPAAAKR